MNIPASLPEEPQPRFSDKTNTVWIGYLLLIISFSTFCLVESLNLMGDNKTFSIFILHYLLAGAYVVILLVKKSYGLSRSWRKENLDQTAVLINLFLISAYALNREIPVFEDSADWLSAYLILTSLTLLSFRYFENLPQWVNAIQYGILGSAAILYLYMT